MIGAIRIKSQYVGLTKMSHDKIRNDADRQIQALDQTRELIESWKNSDLGITNIFPYSEKFISIEGFKVIREELFLNLSLSIAAVSHEKCKKYFKKKRFKGSNHIQCSKARLRLKIPYRSFKRHIALSIQHDRSFGNYLPFFIFLFSLKHMKR